ncbi:transcription termination/antitermination protein NusG [Spirochaetota bacterium]
MEHKWFVVHTQAGCEFKAKEYIEQKIQTQGLKVISDVLVPTYTEDVYKNGKRRQVTRKSFPGYILVKMEMSRKSIEEIKLIPTISNFVVQGTELPQPLSPMEYQNIVKTEAKEEGVATPVFNIDFEISEKVLIVDGPFNNFQGTIKAIHPDKKKVEVNVEIFGRTTPVEIDYFKVKKS